MHGVKLAAYASSVGLLVALAGCASTGSTSLPSTSLPPTSLPPTSSVTVPTAAPVGGDVEGGIVTADGRTRTYRIHVPDGLSGQPAPLLVAMHGGTGWAAQFERSSGFDAQADAHGVIVVYPDGVGNGPDETTTRTWNAGDCCGPAVRKQVDDVGFVRQLLDTIEAQYPIDLTRVYAAGHSNGGFMAYRLACELSDRIVAVGLQSGGLAIDTCAPSQPVSVLHIHGAADTNVPPSGGVGSGISAVDFRPLDDSLARTSAAMGCDPQPAVATAGAVTTSTWSGCGDEVTVQLMMVGGAPHKWMSGPDMDSSSAIMAFLLAHPRLA
jgi:polyhydroxybutyrate depolymerase